MYIYISINSNGSFGILHNTYQDLFPGVIILQLFLRETFDSTPMQLQFKCFYFVFSGQYSEFLPYTVLFRCRKILTHPCHLWFAF